MARIRTIKPEFPQSETIGKLSREARLLFIQLWTICDDAGRARAASRMLASTLYPYDNDASELIEGWLEELERNWCITRYSVNDSTFLEVHNWLKHQKIDRPSPSRLPSAREGSRVVSTDSRDLAESHRASDADLGPRTMDLGPRTLGPRKEEEPAVAECSGNGAYAFEDGVIHLNQRDFDKWTKAYNHLDLAAELLALSDWAREQSNWFHAVKNALAKKNREAKAVISNQPKPHDPWEGIV